MGITVARYLSEVQGCNDAQPIHGKFEVHFRDRGMTILLVGANHSTADVSVRERMAFTEEQSVTTLRSWVNSGELDEAMILSTCNRVEVLAVTSADDSQIERQRLIKLLAKSKPGAAIEPSSQTYAYVDEDAVRHVFRVASSLDSMVIGEPQILGQLRRAFSLAGEADAVGPTLNKLLPHAFHLAKRVRNETDIASSAVSISFMAVELGRKIFESLVSKKVLVIGGGETAELAARHLIKAGVAGAVFANRTVAKAEELARKFGGTFISLDRLPEQLAESDIIICSTSSPNFVITPELVSSARTKRRGSPLFLIDISVPRNIDPTIGTMENFFVFNIDDLKALVVSNLDRRQRETYQAEAIVGQEVIRFREVMRRMKLGPAISRLRERMSEIAAQELARHQSQLGSLTIEQEEAIEALLLSTLNKIAHPVITQMRKGALEVEL